MEFGNPFGTRSPAFSGFGFRAHLRICLEDFSEYATIRAKVLEHYSKSSAARARLANRFRKQSAFRPGQRVVYRDPRARAAGGRTPWKEPLSDPYTIVSIQGNRLTLKTKQGVVIEHAHAEDCFAFAR